jgi:UDP-2,3-diacylglucosamine pyrophosphatase LpxH
MHSPERTLALSDLHLGRPSSRAHSPEAVARLVRGFDRVLLLGDIVDHWYTWPDEARELERRLLAVCKSNGVRKVIYFRGNHDACADVAEEFALLDSVLYLHGHALYHRLRGEGCPATRIRALNKRKFGDQRAASRVGRHVWTIVDRVYGAIPMALLNPVAWPWPITRRLARLVQEVAPEGGVRAVVLGHSHRPGVRHMGGLTLFNLGGWIRNTQACAFVHDRNGIKLIRIENGGHEPHLGHVLYEALPAKGTRKHKPV